MFSFGDFFARLVWKSNYHGGPIKYYAGNNLNEGVCMCSWLYLPELDE